MFVLALERFGDRGNLAFGLAAGQFAHAEAFVPGRFGDASAAARPI